MVFHKQELCTRLTLTRRRPRRRLASAVSLDEAIRFDEAFAYR